MVLVVVANWVASVVLVFLQHGWQMTVVVHQQLGVEAVPQVVEYFAEPMEQQQVHIVSAHPTRDSQEDWVVV